MYWVIGKIMWGSPHTLGSVSSLSPIINSPHKCGTVRYNDQYRLVNSYWLNFIIQISQLSPNAVFPGQPIMPP